MNYGFIDYGLWVMDYGVRIMDGRLGMRVRIVDYRSAATLSGEGNGPRLGHSTRKMRLMLTKLLCWHSLRLGVGV